MTCHHGATVVNKPLLHSWLDLDLLVSGEHDPDVDISRVGLLLPQEVVDPCLDVGTKSGGLQLLSSVLVIFPRCAGCFVATITFEPEQNFYILLDIC